MFKCITTCLHTFKTCVQMTETSVLHRHCHGLIREKHLPESFSLMYQRKQDLTVPYLNKRKDTMKRIGQLFV